MAVKPAMSGRATPDVLELCETYGRLNGLRLDVDRRLTALAAEDPGREMLWQELESIMGRLRAVIRQLSATQAEDEPQLRAKAAVLAELLMSREPEGDQIISESESCTLALSLADDTVKLL